MEIAKNKYSRNENLQQNFHNKPQMLELKWYYDKKKFMFIFSSMYMYTVALNFCGSLILQMGDYLCFVGTNFCDWKRLVFLAEDLFLGFSGSRA